MSIVQLFDINFEYDYKHITKVSKTYLTFFFWQIPTGVTHKNNTKSHKFKRIKVNT